MSVLGDDDGKKESHHEAFRWLHFSDLHVGQAGQDRLWPRASTLLLDDLETAHLKTGGFDCLVFSGDLVQKGADREFDEFDKVLDAILGRLGDLGVRPPVITVPGNHDIARPDSLNAYARTLANYWNEPELREGMWKEDQGYLSFLASVFKNYTDWRARAIERGIHIKPTLEGILPGDSSYLLNTAAGRVGLIGLNSTWLQLGGGDYNGQLHVDAKQLHAITDQNPDEWSRQNDLNLLVTHQPSSWLHADSPASWDADLNPAGRFDLHLFGHMHQPEIMSFASGGGRARRNVQAASLFGLETFGAGHTRIQGYSANQITVGNESRSFVHWPRKLIPVTGGRMKLVPDSHQDIDESTGALSIPYTVERRAVARSDKTFARASDVLDGDDERLVQNSFDLAAIHHPLQESKAHQKVRRLEQDACVSALQQEKIAWLVSDWGMAKDGFITTVCARLEVSRSKVFRIDFDGYDGKESFFDGFRSRFGATFQQMCDAVAEAGPCILLLEAVDLSSSENIEAALEAFLKPVGDFISEAFILVHSRRRPKNSSLPIVELKALDEADLAIYVRESELGGIRFAKPDAVSQLFRHTDGVPSRLDDALRDLEIVSLNDLLAANTDYGDIAPTTSSAPSALVATVDELARSSDRAEERAFQLLLALSGFPQGEQLTRLKRFLGIHPFYPAHARELLERALVDTITITDLEGLAEDNTQKALIVPRPVRDYIRSIMDDETAKSFDRKSLELYFGSSWTSGKIDASPIGRRVRKALCDGYEVSNAATLILRSIRRALNEENELERDELVRLASAFIEGLMSGDHFRAAASLSQDVIRLLEEFGTYARDVNFLRYELARSLRMSGRGPQAQGEFELLDLSALSKSQRQSAELGLALTLERTNRSAAAEAAKRVIAIDRHSAPALQAKIMLAEQIEDPKEKRTKLRRLLAIADKQERKVLANNIRLSLAQDEEDQTAISLLKEVLEAAKHNHDFYNQVRAVVTLAERQSQMAGLTEAEHSRLVAAYHFLYSERLSSLFDRCHAVLWNEFERAGQTKNMLNLFRHSSFIWRLNGQDRKEATYLAKLVKLVSDAIASETIRGSRDGAYFIVRVSVVMDEAGNRLLD